MVDSISAGLSAPTTSGLGIVAASVSPKLSYEIGQHFKKNRTEGSASHILAHTVLGAAVAAAGGNDALTAGLAAGGAEAVAPILSSYLYGGKKPSELTADEKSTISSIVGLAGSALGAMTGDVGSTIQSGNVAQNAVENNDFLVVSQGVEKKLAANKKKKSLKIRLQRSVKIKVVLSR